MPFASYTVRRVFGPVWKWEANYRGITSARGYGMTQPGARWAARGWLRGESAAVRKGSLEPVKARQLEAAE